MYVYSIGVIGNDMNDKKGKLDMNCSLEAVLKISVNFTLVHTD